MDSNAKIAYHFIFFSCLITAVTLFPFFGYSGGGGSRGGALETTQLANNDELVAIYAKQVSQVEKLVEQVQMATYQYQNMLLHTQALSDYDAINIIGYLKDLQNAVTRIGSLYSSLGNFASVFETQYGISTSYGGYDSLAEYTSAERSQYWKELENTLNLYDMSLSDFADSAETLSTIKTKSDTAEGRMQVLQAGNEIANYSATELGKLRVAVNQQSALLATAEAHKEREKMNQELKEHQLGALLFRPYKNEDNRSAVLDLF